MCLHRGRRLAVVAILVGAMAAVAVPSAAGAPGPGTFTKITTPSGPIFTFHFNVDPGAFNNFTVSGVASVDVTSVDIVCDFLSNSGSVSSQSLATDVPVTGGAFSTIATVATLGGQCRLRAIPHGESPDYVASYSGPLLYLYATGKLKGTGSVIYDQIAADEQGDGIALAEDAGTCGAALIATVVLPAMQAEGSDQQICAFSLTGANDTASGTSTASTIQVDGDNAYLPGAVNSYLIQDRGLAVQQSALTVTFSKTKNDLTATESAPLMRCSAANTYPPTMTSCPTLVSSGVEFRRVSTLDPSDHQIGLRDSFVSEDGAAHSLRLQYGKANETSPPPTGAPGYIFPGHSARFSTPAPAAVITGLGKKAGTVLARSDIYSGENDPQADTLGLTWSRAPSSLSFVQDTGLTYGMSYALTVPKHGTAYLGFELSESLLTSATQTLARRAVAAMVNSPSITSPHNGAKVHGKKVTVKGTATVGANGLPTSVTVNGHKATLKATKSGKSFSAKVKEPAGAHTITVIAKDVAGNTASRRIKIHVKH